MREFRKRSLVAISVIVFLLAAVSAWRPEPEVILVVTDLDELVVQTVESQPAADPLAVSIDGVSPGDEVSVVIESSYGIRSVDAVAEASSVEVEVPPSDHAEAGLVVIDVWTATGYGSTTLRLTPGDPVGPLDVYLGPRTMVADGDDLAMLVAVPVDVQGNPVATGTQIETRTIRADLSMETDATATNGLLGYRILFSETVAGATTVTAKSGAANGPARRVDEVAGPPVDLVLELLDPVPPADGRALFRVVTNELTDQFGNLVPDGTIVTMDATGVTGVRRQTATTIAAVATFVVQVPNFSGEATFTAYASTAVSSRLVVDFEPAVADLPVALTLPDAAGDTGITINVGPVTTLLGSLIPDGTEALITLESIDGQTSSDTARIVRRTQLYRGEGSVRIDELELDDFDGDIRLTVTVLGVKAIAVWGRS